MNPPDPLRELEKELLHEWADCYNPIVSRICHALSRVIHRMEKAATAEATEIVFSNPSYINPPPQPEARYEWHEILNRGPEGCTVLKDGSLRAWFNSLADAEAYVAMKEGRKP